MWRSRKILCWALAASVIGGVGAASAAAQSSPPPIGAYTTVGAWSFRTAPKLHPPKLSTDAPTRQRKLASGYFLTASFPNITASGAPMTGQSGPMILDNQLRPVWFSPVPTNVVALDLKQQMFEGKPALSWWQGVISSTGATVSGTVFVVNQHYRQVATLSGDTADGWTISPHDVVIRGDHAWVTAYKYLYNQDLSAYGGAKSGALYDFAVQEYDLSTGKLLYSWDAFNPGGTPNVPLSDSETPAPSNSHVPWDAYHGNSIQLVGSNEFLVSMRNTWAAYLVDITTGHVVWTLGGKTSNPNDIQPASDAQFQFQHNALLLPNNEVSLFDDHCCAIAGPGKFVPPPAGSHSRGLLLKLDLSNNTASMVAQYLRSPAVDAAFTGSMQVLPNGNVLVGWGSQPYFTEFSQSGKTLLDGVWPGLDLSYRVLFTSTWVGTPYYPPSGTVRKHAGHSTVYASWDGATQIVTWQVLAGTRGHLKVVGTALKGGFVTAIHLKHAYKAYKVEALGARGRVLGTSGLFPKPSGSGFSPGNY